MKRNKFYYVQTAKVVNVSVVKDVSWYRIKFCPRLGIFAHFSNFNFLVIASINKIRGPTGLELVHI